MVETQEKCVVESESKEKIGNTITQLDLLHRFFINHGEYGVIPEGRAGRVAAGDLTTTHTRLSVYVLWK